MDTPSTHCTAFAMTGTARRKRPALVSAMLVALLIAVATAAAASQSMRCDRTFIRVGDSKFQVLEACGEPKFRDQISGEDGPRVEQWVYASEWSRFDRMITFVAGRVARIESLTG